jgi:hypothetical protein
MPTIILKLLDFGRPSFISQSIFLAPANGYLAFCGEPANVTPTGIWRLWLSSQRGCG